MVLVGYVGACVSVVLEYWTQWGQQTNEMLDIAFLLTVPFIVVTLAKRFRPALPAVLLTLSVPGLLVISEVTSLGNIVLPVAFAFGILGRRIARETGPVTASQSDATAISRATA